MASKYIQKFPIPGSFPDILHDFVREVLRDQPENIYEYGAAYFTAMDEVSQSLSRSRRQVFFVQNMVDGFDYEFLIVCSKAEFIL